MSPTPESTPTPTGETPTSATEATPKPERSERFKKIMKYAIPLGAVAVGLGFNDIAVQGMDMYNTAKDVVGADAVIGGGIYVAGRAGKLARTLRG